MSNEVNQEMLQEKVKKIESEPVVSGKEWAKKESKYEFGFSTHIKSDSLAKGLDENVVRAISAKRNEPEYMLKYRLKAFRCWEKMKAPQWANIEMDKINFQDISYYSAPIMKKKLASLDELDPEIKDTFDKLGLPLSEQKRLANVAVDAVFDSVSVATTFKKKLAKAGVIFCSISEAIRDYPELIQKYMGSVVPPSDNFYAALNSAVFTDGSFVYVPPNTKCPMELSTYFRINDQDVGQFERTLIVCDNASYVSYLEGCTAPLNDKHQLHAAIVELVALDHAEIKYSTVQNWYPGDPKTGKGGIYNFVTKRAKCEGAYSKVSWTQVETGSAITWKYPSCILKGEHSVGEFYSIALTHHFQQADTGTKMIHLGKNTKSTIMSKGISAGQSKNTYRGQVKVFKTAQGAKNYTQCDSMLVGDQCSAHTFPSIQSKNQNAVLEHEATTSKISEEQLFYFQQRGISVEDALSCIVNGFCKDVFQQLPVEFAVETSRLLAIKLEDSVG